MKTEKMSLKGIKNVLSRAEMKKIMAGSGGCGTNGNVCCQCTGNWGYPTVTAVDSSGLACSIFCESLSTNNYSGYAVACSYCS
ncbi:MAG: hypothetical protein JWQ63_2281 [Mucilaginibacter sp.]|nr:hypothetical protein [Mucilaginibacter sp.]